MSVESLHVHRYPVFDFQWTTPDGTLWQTYGNKKWPGGLRRYLVKFDKPYFNDTDAPTWVASIRPLPAVKA